MVNTFGRASSNPHPTHDDDKDNTRPNLRMSRPPAPPSPGLSVIHPPSVPTSFTSPSPSARSVMSMESASHRHSPTPGTSRSSSSSYYHSQATASSPSPRRPLTSHHHHQSGSLIDDKEKGVTAGHGSSSDGGTGTGTVLDIKYGMKVVLRTAGGSCLAVVGPESTTSSAGVPTAPGVSSGGGAVAVPKARAYRVVAEGKGLGHSEEAFTMVFATRRDDKGTARWYDTVALRSSWAKERFLAIDKDSESEDEVGLFRNLISSSERWTLVPVDPARLGEAGTSLYAATRYMATTATSPVDDMGSSTLPLSTAHPPPGQRGPPVQAGSKAILRNCKNGQVLSIQDNHGRPRVCTVGEDESLPLQAVFEVSFCGAPHYPSWNCTRPYLSGAFLFRHDRHQLPSTSTTTNSQRAGSSVAVAKYPVTVQEQMLVEDLLSAVTGYEAKYIRLVKRGGRPHVDSTMRGGEAAAGEGEVEFELDAQAAQSMDQSIATLITKFLPLCACCVRIKDFIQVHGRYEYGLVAHALSAGISALFKEYLVLVAQLEKKALQGQLSPNKLWFQIQPSFRILEILDGLCQKVWEVKGGALLNVIKAMASGGDAQSARIHEYLLMRASVPYFEMLEQWVYHGHLDDPYREFMIREEDGLQKENVVSDFNATYWDSRYTIQVQHVLADVKDFREEILTTGKYLNVFRECGQVVTSPEGWPTLRYSFKGNTAALDMAYRRSCGLVLDLLMKDHDLLRRLTSLKHYFLLDQGDCFVHFMNSAEEELLKRASEVSMSRIESLFHLSIQMSTAGVQDPYKDHVTTLLKQDKLITHLSAIHTGGGGGGGGSTTRPPHDDDQVPRPTLQSQANKDLMAYEALVLDYNVEWPLSLIVSRRAVTKYQLLFRHLFLVKFVERRLHSCWADQQATKELVNVRKGMGPAYCLRHRMQHFLGNYMYYMMFEVVEPHWQELLVALGSRVANVDDVLRLHGEFQDTCLKECLLTHQPLLHILSKILMVCLTFTNYVHDVIHDKMMVVEDISSGSRGGGANYLLPQTSSSSSRWSSSRSSKRGATQQQPSSSSKHQYHDRRVRVEAQTEALNQEVLSQAFGDHVAKFALRFDAHMKDFMQCLMRASQAQYHSHLTNLCSRMEYWRV